MTDPIAPDKLRLLMEEAADGPTVAVFETVYSSVRRARRVRAALIAAGSAIVVVAAITIPILATRTSRVPSGLTTGTKPSSTPQAETRPTSDPLDLVGSWHVEAAGEPASTSLILGGRGQDLELFRRCGLLDGGWDADAYGNFIGDVSGGDGSCFQGQPAPTHAAPAWLVIAVGFQDDGNNRQLLDAGGHVVATLIPGAHPTTGPTDSPDLASPPAITPDLQQRLRLPAALPASVTPANEHDLIGHWKPLGVPAINPRSSLTFHADGTWSATDGCNPDEGRFAVGPGGELLTTSSSTTLVDCGYSAAWLWVISAGRVGVVNGQLVMYDNKGQELGRYQPI